MVAMAYDTTPEQDIYCGKSAVFTHAAAEGDQELVGTKLALVAYLSLTERVSTTNSILMSSALLMISTMHASR